MEGPELNEAGLDEVIPTGTVRTRIHQLYGTSRPYSGADSFAANIQDRDRFDALVSWGRHAGSHFANSQTPPSHSFVLLKTARHRHSDEHAATHARSLQRSDRSAARMDSPPVSDAHFALPPTPPSYGDRPVRSPSEWARSSVLSKSSGSEARRQSARELFDQHGIVRPPGWLSEDDEEDTGLSGDGTASPREVCRVCHMCSARVWSTRYCSACGHRLCKRCLCEVPSNTLKLHEDFSHHPEQTISLDENMGLDHEHSTDVSSTLVVLSTLIDRCSRPR
jgi:hypothetical protein